jgi:type II secretory pathway component PulL
MKHVGVPIAWLEPEAGFFTYKLASLDREVLTEGMVTCSLPFETGSSQACSIKVVLLVRPSEIVYRDMSVQARMICA